MNLLADVAQFAGQQHLHLRMNVLYPILNHEITAFGLGVDILQFGEQLRQLVGLEETNRL